MGGYADPAGNQWWIATRIEDLTPEELQVRMTKHMQESADKGQSHPGAGS